VEVDPAKLREAADLVGGAAAHFKERCFELYDIATETEGGRRLGGGYGETGGYQESLLDFCWAFRSVLDEFLTDETKFYLFLEGFQLKIQQAAGMYETSELRNTEMLGNIARTLDAGER
jgi:hypothetical protein